VQRRWFSTGVMLPEKSASGATACTVARK